MLVPDHIHVATVWIEASFDDVWSRLADPLRYPEIYSSWSDVTVGPTRKRGLYRVTEDGGSGADLTIETSRDHGAVDLELVDDDIVHRHTRLFDVRGEADGCLVVELTERGDLEPPDFEALLGSIETDLHHAKRVIEAEV